MGSVIKPGTFKTNLNSLDNIRTRQAEKDDQKKHVILDCDSSGNVEFALNKSYTELQFENCLKVEVDMISWDV